MLVKITHTVCAIFLAFSVTSCVLPTIPDCQSGEAEALQDSLYFGTGKTDGFVTQSEWDGFLASTVTPRFPKGLTVTPATGQWQGADGLIVKEPSYVLTLVHSGDSTSEKAIVDIIQTYKRQFQQEAVLRVKLKVCFSH